MKSSNLESLISRANASGSYEDKEVFHKEGLKILRKFAKELGLQTGQYKVSSNKGGSAVLGEVSFISNFLYVQISGFMSNQEVLYRACNGMKDYSGLQNNYIPARKLDPQLFAKYFLDRPEFFSSLKPEHRADYEKLSLKEIHKSNSDLENYKKLKL